VVAVVVERVAIQDLQDAYVLCRALGHAWDDNPTAQVDSQLYRASRGVLTLRCTRCTTERFDYINQMFEVATRYYRYPDHYKSIPGEGTRPNLRAELLRRSLLIRSARRRNGKRA
jgi:hypothetical protein